ncbi:MAG: cytidine deaminase, partial [Bacilli bacterium]|nr:cytidine deaminase [Bacilli bacterium]
TISTSAEKSAVISMINNGENSITKLVILNELEEIIPPSIECLDYLLELSSSYGNIDILINETGESKKVIELLPDWWGTYRNKK